MSTQWQTTLSYGSKQGFPLSGELKGALNGPIKLEIGDKCFVYQKGKLKKVKVTSIIQLEGAVKTYNLTGLKVGNSYFANGILVNSENPTQNKVVEEIKKGDKE